MKNPRKRKNPSKGYNRRRAAERRFLNSPLGKLCKKKISRQTKEEIMVNGWREPIVGLTWEYFPLEYFNYYTGEKMPFEAVGDVDLVVTVK